MQLCIDNTGIEETIDFWKQCYQMLLEAKK